MHLTRPLQFPEAQRVPEPAVLCGQVMASVGLDPSITEGCTYVTRHADGCICICHSNHAHQQNLCRDASQPFLGHYVLCLPDRG